VTRGPTGPGGSFGVRWLASALSASVTGTARDLSSLSPTGRKVCDTTWLEEFQRAAADLRAQGKPLRHVLVVGAEKYVTRLIEVNLQRAGLCVATAAGARDALAAIQSAPPDLILADLFLPAFESIELLRRLKADPATADLRIIWLSDQASAPRAGLWHD
jgi:CheY-like chemotaxis protein